MRKPDFHGVASVWKIDPEKVQRPEAEPHASVATYLVKGPFHSFWDHWIVTVVHLRDLPGQSKAPFKKTPDMTHEFLTISLDPGKPGEAATVFDPDALPFPVPYMVPIDAVVQFKVDSDAQAADICTQAVKLIAAGQASPDSDFRGFWEKMIPGTAACPCHPDKGLH